MPTPKRETLYQYLRRTTLRHNAGDLADALLLECWLTDGDDAAFEAMVRRHGSMVLGVCRRVLGDAHESEDAFQATFLVFVRKAASILPRSNVGNWLHGVAYKTALRSRSAIARRRTAERKVADMVKPAESPDDVWQQLMPILDQELQALPENYRLPIVLCDLEGKTRKQASRQLGWAEGTVASRLARGRAMLAQRMRRHGLPLSSAALAAVLTQQSATAAVPASLLAATLKATAMFIGQAAAGGVIPGPITSLAKGMLRAMLLHKLSRIIAVVVVICPLVFGAGSVFVQTSALEPKDGTRNTAEAWSKDASRQGKSGPANPRAVDAASAALQRLAKRPQSELQEKKKVDRQVEKTTTENTINIKGQLNKDDLLGAVVKAPTKMHYLKMAKGKTYVVRPGEAEFKVFLMVEDSDKALMTDLRETVRVDSGLLFTAPKDDTYGIVVTTGDDKLGKYEVIIAPASEKLHELARLKSPLDEALKSRAKANQAKTEADLSKVWRHIHEVAADFAVQAIAFAKGNPDDPASDDALKYALANLWLLVDWNAFPDASPLAAKRLGIVVDQAKSKDIRAIAMYALAGNLASQALSAARKKDVKQAASLNGQAAELLDRVVKEDTNIVTPGSREPVTQVAKDLLFVLTNLSVGCKALDLVGEDIVGKPFKLSDYRGKVTVVYFWGSWCGPCKAMIPHEKELALKFAEAPFALVGINTDNDKNKAKEFLQKEGITWTQVWDGGSTTGPLVRAWRVDAFPTVYVLDADSIIRHQAFGDSGVALDEIVDELLNGLKK